MRPAELGDHSGDSGGRSRSLQFAFEITGRADFPLTLLWRRGEDVAVGRQRLAAIAVDASAGRAPRDAMLAQFDGLDRWISRAYRERVAHSVAVGAIHLERLHLIDAPIRSSEARWHVDRRWHPDGPLHRAATAVVAHAEQRGIDPAHMHLHGRDIAGPDTPYFAGMGLRYLWTVPSCLIEHNGVEWIEVVHPTRTRALDALRITPVDPSLLADADWSPA